MRKTNRQILTLTLAPEFVPCFQSAIFVYKKRIRPMAVRWTPSNPEFGRSHGALLFAGGL